MRSSRYSGRWSVYLLTIRWASSPGPASPLAIGVAGFGAAITTVLGSRNWHGGGGGGVGRGPGSPDPEGGGTCSGLVSVGPGTDGGAPAGGAGGGSAAGAGKGAGPWRGGAG